MITFLTWTAIALLLWRVETLAHQITLLQRGQTNPPKTEQPPKPQPAQTSSIFEPLPQAQKPVQTPVTHVPSAQQASPKQPLSVDKIFSWVGGFILLLGIIFCIKYSIEKDLISPQVRVALGTLTGVILWASGAFMQKENLKTTSHTLLACGLCVCYLTWFSAYAFYHIFSAQTAFGLLALIAVASFATAVWKKTFYIGILAQIIGFLTPFLLVSGATPVYWFLLGYGALITVSAVASSFKYAWDSQIYTAIIFSALYLLAFVSQANSTLLMSFAILLGAVFATAAALKRNGAFLLGAFIAQIPLISVLFVEVIFGRHKPADPFLLCGALWWAVFTLVPFLLKKHFINDKKAWITAALCGAFIGGLMQVVVWCTSSILDGGWIPFLFALVYGTVFYAVYDWQHFKKPCQYLRLSALGAVCVLFVTVLIYCALFEQWIAIALALQGVFLVYLWRRIKLSVWQTLGAILLSLSALQLCFLSYDNPQPFLLNDYLYTYGICIISCWMGALRWRKTSRRSVRTYLRLLGGILFFALLNIEIASYFSAGKALSLNLFGQVNQAAAYTIVWALCGAACLLLNSWRTKGLNTMGLVLIVLALAKLFLSDIWLLPLSLRIIVSIAVSLILLGISFCYQQRKRN